MAKTFFMGVLLIAIIAILLYIAVKPPATITIPTQQPVVNIGTPTPKAEEPERIPTPRAEETAPLPAGVPIEKVYPLEVNFWVNDIKVPTAMSYGDFIPIKQDNLKTFAGAVGPYAEDPTAQMKIVLCSEFYKVQAAPACETVPLIFKGGYVSFARGYQYDEYIGGMAAKDYVAYFDVYAGDTRVGTSNKAIIRTIKD